MSYWSFHCSSNRATGSSECTACSSLTAAKQVQLARVLQRPGIDAGTARAILAAQSSRAARLAAADDVLFNEAPFDLVERRAAQLHALYVRLASKAAPLGSV